MNQTDRPTRPELLAASDDTIDDAVKYADLMTLRGLTYQLTGDAELRQLETEKRFLGYYEVRALAGDRAATLVQQRAAKFLKEYRDAGAGPMGVGPYERLPESLGLIAGEPIPEEDLGFFLEELALDPWVRSLKWQAVPDPGALADFTVTIIGAGMGGLNLALQLKRAGIPYTVIEKNSDVGGTWFENRYPGARVDTPSRGYTHLVGADFGYPHPFCPGSENKRYFDWVADSFDLRKDIIFNTEVDALTWNENDAMWEISLRGPAGARSMRSRAVITAVGFLNRPNVPELPGIGEFRGRAWHTARWPGTEEWRGKRIGVIGTGATGYQMIPELALEAAHVTVFQRTPQWVFRTPKYRAPFPPQVNWLDRNLPFHSNFMRFRTLFRAGTARMLDIDPLFHDPYTRNLPSKRARDTVLSFLKEKLADPRLIEIMTPSHPPFSSRPIAVDPDYSILDAIQRDNVTLVTSDIRCATPTGLETQDGNRYDVDIIVYATGFRATDYLFPMTITGREGATIKQLWSQDGARAYMGCMMPGFPNLWCTYGPNMNGLLHVSGLHELTAHYVLRCIERAILSGKRSVEVKDAEYWSYNRLVDERNSQKVWSDSRAHNYYWGSHGRTPVLNPFAAPEMWRFLRQPDFDAMTIE